MYNIYLNKSLIEMLHNIYTQYLKPISIYNQYLSDIDPKDTEVNPLFRKCTLSNFLLKLKDQYNKNYDHVHCLHKLNSKIMDYLQDLNNLLLPTDFNNYIDSLLINQFDIIDLEGHRGNGYYYVYNMDEQLYIEKTLGEYGYYLPYIGTKFIKINNIKTSDDFQIDNILGFHVPRGIEVYQSKINNKFIVDNNDTYLDLSFSDGENDEYIIDGEKYIGVMV